MRKPLIALLMLMAASNAGAQTLTGDHPVDNQIRARGVEAVIWGMPAVNAELMLEAMLKAGGRLNQIVYWSDVSDWKNQTLTPNPSTIYLMPFIDTRQAGPMVIEIPPADGGQITGTILDAWQNALEDVGPAGADKGKGGRYLIVPPGYTGEIPQGYIVLKSTTDGALALLRSDIGGGSKAEVARAVAYGKRIKLYPLSSAADPATTTFVDARGIEFDSTIPYDVRFYEALDRFVQREPWQERDKAMIDQLKTIGIVKGKRFAPSDGLKRQLEQSAIEAQSLLDDGYEALFSPYFASGHWALPLAPEVTEGLSNGFTTPGVYPVDTRGVFFSMAFSSVKHLGKGQFYLVTLHDSAGAPFDGGKAYRLKVPANVPVDLYWSATVYDRATHALIRDQKWPSRGSSTPGLKKNPDGSVDLFFGPSAPAAGETNWVPTKAGRGWELMMRFYGPQKPLFDKTWRSSGLEKAYLLEAPAAGRNSRPHQFVVPSIATRQLQASASRS